jgi:hypothetical protein
MSDGNHNNPGSISPADQAFGIMVFTTSDSLLKAGSRYELIH